MIILLDDWFWFSSKSIPKEDEVSPLTFAQLKPIDMPIATENIIQNGRF